MAELPARVALLGAGVIGGGWAARMLLNGVDVSVYDPDPQAARKLPEMVARAREAYALLTLAPLPPEGRLEFAGSVEQAVEGAALIQESAPERVAVKHALLAAATAAAAPEALVCSSTSGLRPSLLAEAVAGPGRFLVAHPFNPVYLLPLVELCAGEATVPDTLVRAHALYRALGMHPLVVRHEIDGFIADRLLEALWREALWLVADDVASVEEIDDAIRYAAGIRWSIMGTFLTYRIAGGEAGMRHFIAQFGPALQAPWTKLVDVPELTEALRERIVAQSDAQARGRSVAELERERDRSLVAVLHALRAQDTGAGQTLADWERALMRVPAAAGDGRAPVPLRYVRDAIPGEWVDYNRHVHESRYLQLCGDATDALLPHLGIDGAYIEAHGSYYTVETHLSHLGQLFAGDRVEVLTQILGHDDKRLHLFHTVRRAGDSDPVATAEQMLVHVDAASGRVTAAPPAVLDAVRALAAAHAKLPAPERVGRRIAAPALR